MNPTNFKEQNFVFTKPEGWTDDQCGDLPVWKGNTPDGPIIISCWKLSPEELATIQATGVVWLHIIGGGMPPVYVGAESSFSEPTEQPKIVVLSEAQREVIVEKLNTIVTDPGCFDSDWIAHALYSEICDLLDVPNNLRVVFNSEE